VFARGDPSSAERIAANDAPRRSFGRRAHPARSLEQRGGELGHPRRSSARGGVFGVGLLEALHEQTAGLRGAARRGAAVTDRRADPGRALAPCDAGLGCHAARAGQGKLEGVGSEPCRDEGRDERDDERTGRRGDEDPVTP